ncbi:hypothetical protein [Hungatella hathewayi]|uniref:hypothetical protein n=1 Tax=Hungatella hathewayi TaxID=154046 RepID=UPI003563A2CE
MVLAIDNMDQVAFENENARIVLAQVLKDNPEVYIDLFSNIEISERLAMDIWLNTIKGME